MILSRPGLCQRPVLLPSSEQEELEEPEEHQEGQTHVLIPDVWPRWRWVNQRGEYWYLIGSIHIGDKRMDIWIESKMRSTWELNQDNCLRTSSWPCWPWWWTTSRKPSFARSRRSLCRRSTTLRSGGDIGQYTLWWVLWLCQQVVVNLLMLDWWSLGKHRCKDWDYYILLGQLLTSWWDYSGSGGRDQGNILIFDLLMCISITLIAGHSHLFWGVCADHGHLRRWEKDVHEICRIIKSLKYKSNV